MAKEMLKCPACGSDLKSSLGFDGCDWESEAGEGSGFDWEITLNCINDNCAIVYSIGRVKESFHFSEPIERIKVTR